MIRAPVASRQSGVELRTNAMVVAQVWRDRQGRQANLARLLRAADVRAIDHQDGRQAGVLLGQAGTADPIDACVVLLAEPGDRILTTDPDDLTVSCSRRKPRRHHHLLTIAAPHAAREDVQCGNPRH
jgi:hypothetical protein